MDKLSIKDLATYVTVKGIIEREGVSEEEVLSKIESMAAIKVIPEGEKPQYFPNIFHASKSMGVCLSYAPRNRRK